MAVSALKKIRNSWRTVGLSLKAGAPREQLAVVAKQSMLGIWASGILSAFIVAYSFFFFPFMPLLIWGIFCLIYHSLAIVRLTRRAQINKHNSVVGNSMRGLRGGVLQTLLLGIVWSSVLIVLPGAPDQLVIMLLFALAGVGVGGAILFSAVPLFSLVFAIASLAPAFIFMLFHSSSLYSGLTWIWPLHIATIINISMLTHASILKQQQAEHLSESYETIKFENALAAAVNESSTLEKAAGDCLALLVGHIDWQLAHLYVRKLRDPDNIFVCSGMWADKDPDRYKEFRLASAHLSLKEGNDPAGHVIAKGETQCIQLADLHTMNKKDWPKRAKYCASAGLERAILAPVFIGDRIEGIVEVFDDKLGEISPDLASKVEFAGLQLGRAIERRNTTEQSQFLQAVLGNIEDEIVACDANGNLFYNNDPVAVMQNKGESIHFSQWATNYQLLHGDGVTPLKLEEIPLYRAWMGEEIKNEELINVRNGVAMKFIVSGQAMTDLEGNPIGAMVSMHNVSDMRQLQNQLIHAQKMEIIGQLAGGLAHDFNNILSIALGNLELLQLSLSLDTENSSLLNNSILAMEDAAKLTGQLLTIARRQQLNEKATDINALIGKIQNILSRSLGAGITFTSSLANDLWLVKVDQGQLENTLMNLALNARDAMKGSGLLDIASQNCYLSEAEAAHEGLKAGAYVSVTVTDSGTGIPPDLQSRIFEPFFTTKSEYKGTGLGLSMVHGFVKQSGGVIKVASKPGEGAAFTIYLPRSLETDTANQSADLVVSQEFERVPERKTKFAKILLVEDEERLSSLLMNVLSSSGYQCVRANGEDQALALIDSDGPFDLLLSDIVLRNSRSGFEIATSIRNRFPDCKIMFMSGYTDPASSSYNKYWADFPILKKPFKFQVLLQEIKSVLDAGDSYPAQ